MVENGRNGRSVAEAMERVSVAVAEALESGVSEEDLQTLFFSSAAAGNGSGEPEHPGYDPEAVYSVLPEGLIDVPSASKKYNLQDDTIRAWVRKGQVKLCGRLKGPATGGGFLLVVEEELVAYMSAPRNKGGRPRFFSSATSGNGSGEPDHSEYEPEPVYDELPPGLIDLPSAARKYGIPRRTIQTWIRTNKVRSCGRLKGSARGGGYLLVDEGDLVEYHGCPKSRGRPKKVNKSITC